MSFILDALKKSDKRRQQVAVPRLDTVHAEGGRKKAGRPGRALVWVFLLLLSCGGLGGFLFLSAPDVPSTAGSRSLAPPPASVATRVATTPQVTDPIAVPAPHPLQPKIPAPTAAVTPVAAPAQPGADEVLPISELPLAVQRRIPELHMSLHAYNQANPDAGLVRVNGQILRPGSRLDGKYLLEEISAEGAIFRTDGYRFLLPRN